MKYESRYFHIINMLPAHISMPQYKREYDGEHNAEFVDRSYTRHIADLNRLEIEQP